MPPWEWKQLEQAYLLALACLGVSRNDTRIVGQIKAGCECPPPPRSEMISQSSCCTLERCWSRRLGNMRRKHCCPSSQVTFLPPMPTSRTCHRMSGSSR